MSSRESRCGRHGCPPENEGRNRHATPHRGQCSVTIRTPCRKCPATAA